MHERATQSKGSKEQSDKPVASTSSSVSKLVDPPTAPGGTPPPGAAPLEPVPPPPAPPELDATVSRGGGKRGRTRRGMHERSFRFGPHFVSFKPPHAWQGSCGRDVAHIWKGHPNTKCTRTISYKGEDIVVTNDSTQPLYCTLHTVSWAMCDAPSGGATGDGILDQLVQFPWMMLTRLFC